jgi:hypothetical protein
MVEWAAMRGHGVKVFSTLVGMSIADVSRLERIRPKRFVVHLADDGTFMKVRVDCKYLDVLKAVARLQMEVTFMAIGPLHPKVSEILPSEPVLGKCVISRAGNVSRHIITPPAHLGGAIKCAAERLYRNVLLPNGDVTLCCMDYGKAHVIGNLLETAYDQLHSGHRFQVVLDRMAGAPGPLICRTCEFGVQATT